MKLKRFYQSSSFKMAVLFSILLLGAAVILISSVLSSTDKSLSGSVLIWMSLALMTSVPLISFFIAIYVVRRINSISSTAQKIIETGKLNSRIPMDFEWDDLSQLASILNQLFSEVESLVKNVSQVSNNIAHDLRTPLTRLRNEIQLIEDQDKKERLTEEVDILLGMFNGLLRIANVESKYRYEGFEEVELSQLVDDAVDLYEPVAMEKNIMLRVQTEQVYYQADRDLFFQALTNLIDNAIKYTPVSKQSSNDDAPVSIIDIVMQQDKDTVRIMVKDQGCGIDEQELDLITRRFYRVDKSRCQQGNGLGLALVKAVVVLHKGKLLFTNNNPQGLIATIVLDKAKAEPKKLIIPKALINKAQKR